MEKTEVCKMCEAYMEGIVCDSKCPVESLLRENKRLKTENSKLRNEMSYMVSPMWIGGRNEMGG